MLLKSWLKFKNVLKTVAREIPIIRATQDKHSKILDLLLEKHNFSNAVNEAQSQHQSDFEISFPLVCDKDLVKLECLLVKTEMENSLVAKLKGFGGKMFQDHTRRILRYIFTDRLAQEYSWSGSKDKKKFSNLKISQLIIDAVHEENNALPRNKIEEIVKTWLRHAKERSMYVPKAQKK